MIMPLLPRYFRHNFCNYPIFHPAEGTAATSLDPVNFLRIAKKYHGEVEWKDKTHLKKWLRCSLTRGELIEHDDKSKVLRVQT